MFRFTNRDVWVGSQVRRFQIVDHPGATAIWAEQDGSVLLVEQYRPAARRYMLELPGGTVEIGEEPMETARREFEGETGYIPEDLTALGHIYPSPGYTTEVMYIFKAKGLRPGTQNLDPGEDLRIRWLSLEELHTMVANGEIHDAKTLVAYYMCFAELSHQS